MCFNIFQNHIVIVYIHLGTRPRCCTVLVPRILVCFEATSSESKASADKSETSDSKAAADKSEAADSKAAETKSTSETKSARERLQALRRRVLDKAS